MRKILLLALFLTLPSVTYANYTIDQNAGTADAGFEFGSTVSVNQQRAQSFTTTLAGTIVDANVTTANLLSPGTHAQLQVWSDSGGLPNAQVGASSNLYTGNVTYTGGSPFSTRQTVTFPTPVTVSASTKYWLVYLKDNGNDASNHYVLDQGATSGGDTASYDGSWHNTSRAFNASIDITTAGGTSETIVTFFGW